MEISGRKQSSMCLRRKTLPWDMFDRSPGGLSYGPSRSWACLRSMTSLFLREKTQSFFGLEGKLGRSLGFLIFCIKNL